MELLDQLKRSFTEAFGAGTGARTFFAPGRVNLIGEHIDYNGGLVFPMGLTQGIYAVARARHDDQLNIISLDRPTRLTIPVKERLTFDADRDWGNYPAGVVTILKTKGFLSPGADIAFGGSLPTGSGVSSSAALEVLTAFLLLSLEQIFPIDRVQLALLAQRAEREFVGVQCGIMDQFAVSMAKRDHAIKLNCSSLEYEHIPLALGDYRILVLNTNVERALAGSKYNERRSECESALAEIARGRPIETLCQASIDEIESIQDPTVRRRAKHVATEQARVLEAVAALRRKDLSQLGSLLTASHRSLKEDYEVTGEALDTIVEAALEQDGCLGARMTGAGFGGCAIALVGVDKIEQFKAGVSRRYRERMGIDCGFIVSSAGDGVRELE